MLAYCMGKILKTLHFIFIRLCSSSVTFAFLKPNWQIKLKFFNLGYQSSFKKRSLASFLLFFL